MRSLACVLLLASLTRPAVAAEPPDAHDSTLILFGLVREARVTAAAVIVDAEEGWALTAMHTLLLAEQPTVMRVRRGPEGPKTDLNTYWQPLMRNESAAVTWRWASPGDDLAIVRLPPAFPGSAMPLARQVGEPDAPLRVLGHPGPRGLFFEEATARAVRRERMDWEWPGQPIDTRILRLRGDRTFPSGYSGGPVVNAAGELAGLVIATPDASAPETYAVDGAVLRAFLTRIYVLESWQALVRGEAALFRRRLQRATALEPAHPLVVGTCCFASLFGRSVR